MKIIAGAPKVESYFSVNDTKPSTRRKTDNQSIPTRMPEISLLAFRPVEEFPRAKEKKKKKF